MGNSHARGNALYREVSSGCGGDTSNKRSKLSLAQKCYEEALQLSSSSEERASCCKNLGALHFLWGKVELEMVPSLGGRSGSATALYACKDHLVLSISFYLKSKVEGDNAGKPKEWLDQLDASLLAMVNWAADQSRILDISDATILRGLCEEFERNGNVKSEAGALANVELAQALFDQAKLSKEEGAEAKVLLSRCEHPLQRASHFLEGLPTTTTTTGQNLSKRISNLQEELDMCQMLCSLLDP